jgi:hypothetical protein
MPSALQKAIKDGAEKVPDRQAKGALAQAVNKITSLTKKADKSKAMVVETGAAVLYTAETQGTLFLASLAEGYFGGDKLKMGGLDLRAPTALLAQGYGLYETMAGKGGGNSLAIGNGLMGSWLASVAVKAGQKLKDKKDSPPSAPQPTGMQGEQMEGVAPAPAPLPAPLPAPAPAPALPQPPPEVAADLAGPVREVVLTPEPTPRPTRSPRRDGRFVRARTD